VDEQTHEHAQVPVTQSPIVAASTEPTQGLRTQTTTRYIFYTGQSKVGSTPQWTQHRDVVRAVFSAHGMIAHGMDAINPSWTDMKQSTPQRRRPFREFRECHKTALPDACPSYAMRRRQSAEPAHIAPLSNTVP